MKQINIESISNKGFIIKNVTIVATSNVSVTSITTRTLCVGQANAVENGIYENGIRTVDFEAGDDAFNTIVYDGTNLWFNYGGIVGTSAITFYKFGMGNTNIINPTAGNILQFNGTNWINVPSTDIVGGCSQIATAELNFVGTYTLNQVTRDVWYPMAPSSTFTRNNTNWSNTSAGILRWSGQSGLFNLEFNCSCSVNSSNRDTEVAIFVNGVIVANSVVRVRNTSSNAAYLLVISKLINLNSGNTIQIFSRNISTNSLAVTVLNYTLIVSQLN